MMVILKIVCIQSWREFIRAILLILTNVDMWMGLLVLTNGPDFTIFLQEVSLGHVVCIKNVGNSWMYNQDGGIH